MNQTTPQHRIADYMADHRLSLGLLLATYGTLYLATVITSGWTPSGWGIDTFNIAPFAVQALIPRSAINPMFFVTSLPALLMGTVLLCKDSIGGLRALTSESRHAAITLTVSGFAYAVVGAWPLQNQGDFPWDWQNQIASYGSVFAWALYVLSLIGLAIGGVSLYVHSKDYRRRHPEFMFD